MKSHLSSRLKYQHKSLLDLVDGLTDQQIRQQVIPGKWSVFENIVHLQTYQHIFFDRIRAMEEENNPSFPRYKADGDSSFLENGRKSTRVIIMDLITVREEISNYWFHGKKDSPERTGTHPLYGTMNREQ